MIYGSLVLASTEAAIKSWPQFDDSTPYQYNQTQHPVRGLLRLAGIDSPAEVHLPQRSKSYYVSVGSPMRSHEASVLSSICNILPHMESEYEATRQLYKLHMIMVGLRARSAFPYLSHVISQGDSNHVGILAQGITLYVLGVYDTIARSVQLVWTDDEYFMSDLRAREPGRYVFYRFPDLSNRPLFLFSPALVSKWLGWTKKFQGPDCLLKSFNALELYLYKDAEIPTRSLSYGQPTAN